MLHFLVVDDNKINACIFTKVLEKLEINADVVDSVEECLQKVSGTQYDIIFVEPMMVGSDTASFLQQLSEKEKILQRKIPVVAFVPKDETAESSARQAEEFDAVLNIPSRGEAVEALIHEQMLPPVQDVDWKLGRSHFPKIVMLLEAVWEFYRTVDVEADTLEELYSQFQAEGNLPELYRTKVHAMKSTANLIGAAKLGDAAKELEYAARDNDSEYVASETEGFLHEWRRYKEKLHSCPYVTKMERECCMEVKEEVQDFSIIIAYLEMLRVAMLEMDIDGMDKAMEQIQAFRYPEMMEGNVRKLSIYVTNMDIEQVEGMVETLMGQCERLE